MDQFENANGQNDVNYDWTGTNAHVDFSYFLVEAIPPTMYSSGSASWWATAGYFNPDKKTQGFALSSGDWFPDIKNVWLMAHEIGHLFGAYHIYRYLDTVIHITITI